MIFSVMSLRFMAPLKNRETGEDRAERCPPRPRAAAWGTGRVGSVRPGAADQEVDDVVAQLVVAVEVVQAGALRSRGRG
jgi:hypothetical protein